MNATPHAGGAVMGERYAPASHHAYGLGAWLAAGSAPSTAWPNATFFLVISMGTATDRAHIGPWASMLPEPLGMYPQPADDVHAAPESPGVQQVLQEIRAKTDLTWAQIARALGVQRRSLHFWAEGRTANAKNTERLMDLAQAINRFDTGDAATTTALLLTPQGAQLSAFEQFCRRNQASELDELRVLPNQLAPEERKRRRATRPIDRLETLHDGEEPMVGEYLGTVPLPEQPN
ncbi:MAG: helix-turn-helix transcriptional regulator [Acidimicrobiaceae bacterium]|nr:helix-turn-helix transcriptional regulator [Acidimicrobiaceae bacterium]